MANTIPLIRGRVLLSTATRRPERERARRGDERVEDDAEGGFKHGSGGLDGLRSRSLGPR